jgi:hypothetical protein
MSRSSAIAATFGNSKVAQVGGQLMAEAVFAAMILDD